MNHRFLIYQHEIRKHLESMDREYYSKNKCPWCDAPYNLDKEYKKK